MDLGTGDVIAAIEPRLCAIFVAWDPFDDSIKEEILAFVLHQT